MTQTSMMQPVEDTEGNTAEIIGLDGGLTELAVSTDDECISLVLTSRQARAIARQLLAMADEQDGEG